MAELGPDGRRLLRVLVDQIKSGRIQAQNPRTFVSYAEALRLLGVTGKIVYAGRRLQQEGLNELNEWTKEEGLPKIAGLIVVKSTNEPSTGYAASHGFGTKQEWRRWWMAEVKKATTFDWSPYLAGAGR